MELFNNIELREPLWLLLMLQPLLLLFIVMVIRRLRQSAYCATALLPWARAPRAGYVWQQTGRHAILLLAWSALALALAGPRVAERIYHNETGDLAEVYLLVDISRSMSATDVLPNRLARAQLEIGQLLARSPTLRIGLIAFANRPHLVAPATTDTAVLQHYLQQLHTGMLPTEGSDVAQAIRFAMRQFTPGRSSAGALLLFTDGEMTPTTPSSQQAVNDAIASLKQAHIDLHVVGLGTTTGAALIDAEQGWLQYQGQAVVSHLQRAQLQNMATLGNGHYHDITDSRSRWQELLDDDFQPLARGKTDNRRNAVIIWRELYGYPLSVALLLLFVVYWQPSARRQPLASHPAWGVLLLLILFSVGTPPLQAAEVSYRDAYKLYTNKQYLPAAQAFAKLPGYAARLAEGSALYQLQRYPQASMAYIQATLQADDDPQRAQALFNLANCYYKQSNYALAITTYRDVLRYQPGRQAATVNLSYAQALYHKAEATKAALAARAGRGPGTAVAPEGTPLTQGKISFDTNHNTPFTIQPELAIPEFTTTPLTEVKPAASGIERDNDSTWTYDIEQIDPARLADLWQHHSESYVWQRLFEWEENFPAPVQAPHTLPGVPPW